jgi:hypothetical protein
MENINYVTIDNFNSIFESDIKDLHIKDFNRILLFGYFSGKFYISNYENYLIDSLKGRLSQFYLFFLKFIHPNMNNTKYYKYICLYDGYREYTLEIDEYENYINNKLINNNKNKVYCFCKKVYDDSYLIPDLYYMYTGGYKNIMNLLSNNIINWENKINMAIYRGNIVNGSISNFINNDISYHQGFKNQRFLLKHLLTQSDNLKQILNYNDNYMDYVSQIKYKYILDIDGYTNSWEGLFWKLYSGSVVIKHKSLWKQWYYDELKEYVHYVPCENNFSNIEKVILWCKENDEICKQITINARNFVLDKLNWDTVMKQCILTFNQS